MEEILDGLVGKKVIVDGTIKGSAILLSTNIKGVYRYAMSKFKATDVKNITFEPRGDGVEIIIFVRKGRITNV